jgi:hypothetical protein
VKSEKRCSEIRKKVLPTLLAIYTGLFLIIIILPRVTSDEVINWNALLITTAIFIAVIAFATTSTISRYRKGFESYKLTIDDHGIRREQHNLPAIDIKKHEIKKIVRHSNGSFIIVGASKLNAISIPAQIERQEEVMQLLEQIRPVEVRAKKLLIEKLFVPISLLGGVLVVVNAFATNTVVDLVCSILLVIVMLGGFIVIQISRNIDYSTRRLSWIFLIPVAAYIVNIVLLFRAM